MSLKFNALKSLGSAKNALLNRVQTVRFAQRPIAPILVRTGAIHRTLFQNGTDKAPYIHGCAPRVRL